MSKMSKNSLFVNIDKKKRVIRKAPKKKTKEAPVVRPKTPLERILGSKKYVKDHYFSDGANTTPDNMRDVLAEPSPFKYADELDQFAYKVMSKAWKDTERRLELAMKYNLRNNYATRQQKDILKRLYVPLQDVKSAKTILDIDPEFYSIVEGRPIAERFNIIEYVENVRDVLRTKILTGYRMDDSMLIEENLLEEQNMIDEITNQYMEYVTSFEEYLANDHQTSMDILKQCEFYANEAFEKYEKYRIKAKEFGMLKSQVSNLEEKWTNSKMYQQFLYMISPMHWRKQHDFYHIISKEEEDDSSVEMLETHSLLMLENRAQDEFRSMEDILQFLKEDYENMHEPLLYFKEPQELINVFRFIELQNLNSLLHSEELAVPLENIKESIASAEANFNQQINDLQEVIDNLEGEILWEEERATALESLARELVNGDFKKLICDESTLNLQVIVEDVYEARIAPNDANLSAFDMMRAIEVKYREFLLQLDYLPYDKVHRAETECYEEQARMMKVAEEAAKKVKQIERLIGRLRSILEAPVEKHIKEPKFRSILHRPTAEKKKHFEQPITEEEREYLYLFTDFCEEVDNIKEYREIRKKEKELEEQVIQEHELEEELEQQTQQQN